MRKVLYTKTALQDLQNIEAFISQDNKYYAHKVVETIFHFTNNLSLFPFLWKTIYHKKWLREIIEPGFGYRIFYLCTNKEVFIITIGKYRNM